MQGIGIAGYQRMPPVQIAPFGDELVGAAWRQPVQGPRVARRQPYAIRHLGGAVGVVVTGSQVWPCPCGGIRQRLQIARRIISPSYEKRQGQHWFIPLPRLEEGGFPGLERVRELTASRVIISPAQASRRGTGDSPSPPMAAFTTATGIPQTNAHVRSRRRRRQCPGDPRTRPTI